MGTGYFPLSPLQLCLVFFFNMKTEIEIKQVEPLPHLLDYVLKPDQLT